MKKEENSERRPTDFSKGVRGKYAEMNLRIGDAFPGIEGRVNVAGGVPCIARTRIPIWLLKQARRLGTSESELLRAYPTLRAEDLANAWAYVRSHQNQIEQQIIENETSEL